jgi:outer membrane receptor protein involved in Fe transport
MRAIITILLLTVPAVLFGQVSKVTLSGVVKDGNSGAVLPYANTIIRKATDSAFVAGTITNADGRFTITGIVPGDYVIETSFVGYQTNKQQLLVGRLSEFLDLGVIEIKESSVVLDGVVVEGRRDVVAETLDRKIFSMADNINQGGGSLLQVMKNLPGVTISDEGTVKLRGNDRVAVLVDGKQTALTGFGNQQSLDNIPASAIERIEIINNPSAKYDANGNAGIINIIFRKERTEGWNGKIGIAGGAGALWVKKENFPTIRPQYTVTPKINPSLSLNYRKHKINWFLQGDNLYTRTLNKNEFTDRYYDNGDTIRQQLKRNRTTNIVTGKTGFDWYKDEWNTISVSGLFSSEKILDRGDEPFFNGSLSERLRLWQFIEDELKTTVTATATWQHKFTQPGRLVNVGFNYTFHRENEKYFFTNIMPTFTGEDSFKLLSDEQVGDLNVDYVQPLRYGGFETGLKLRRRFIPTNMQFFPGLNSPLDVNAGGLADYGELIPAAYGNYVFENKNFEVEAGLRVEYVRVEYNVNPGHPVYKSSGYNYTQPFPNVRLAYKIDDNNTLSAFFNRRVDRPNEVDIRIFPKYDDAEIIKVGNPALRPQFTNSFELGYKTSRPNGYVYGSLYHKEIDATITRIASVIPGSTLIYNIFQNAGHSRTSGVEVILSQNFVKWAVINLNLNAYRNTIDAFSVLNKYPQENTFSADRQQLTAGSIKLNGLFHLRGGWDMQATAVYMSPDIIPQGKIYARTYVDAGIKRTIQKGKGELIFNATDLFNTLRIKRTTTGDGFHLASTDYYETQVFRLGYSYKL